MKKYYCDHCGKDLGSEPANRLALLKPGQSVITCDTFHFCDKCREEFFGWLKGKCACQKQDKPVCKIDNWQSIKALSARYQTTPRKMNTLMAQMHVERRMKKDGANWWWYEYHITAEILQKLTKKLNGGKK